MAYIHYFLIIVAISLSLCGGNSDNNSSDKNDPAVWDKSSWDNSRWQ